ncbi:DUF3630 family protein [Vibrio gallicus]|uniref:DUF3630 family protein n=1 Tax=Vibrio gallicus TaxID=190897 RepID=UPI0021C2F774|nr:DUF3630 family protein [Vibrio gallicus]
MYNFKLQEYFAEDLRLTIAFPPFDHDSFPGLATHLVNMLSATVVEKQQDADLHTWLLDFEGCRLMLKGEHYSESVWLESLGNNQGKEEIEFIVHLLRR